MWLPSIHATSALNDENCNSCSSARSASRLGLSFIVGLQAAEPNRARLRVHLPDQDGTEVIDVGQRRSGHDELVEPRKVTIGIIVRQERGGVQGRDDERRAAMFEPGARVVLD